MNFSKLYLAYLKEREGLDHISTNKGFILYRLGRKTCFIAEWFTLPEYRRTGEGYDLANKVFKICKENGVGAVYCQSDEESFGWELAHKAILNFGFKEYTKEKTIHHYCMEVSKWAEQ